MLILLAFNLELEIKGCASCIVHLENLKVHHLCFFNVFALKKWC